MITEPTIQDRNEQPYVGIRTQVPMQEFKNIIPQFLDELFGWLGKQGIAPSGAPFMRYHIINMDSLMDVELGVPVTTPVAGDQRVAGSVIPAGRYAALVYTGIDNGIKGNAALLDWGAKQGLVWDRYSSDQVDGFGARIEAYLTDPADEPNQAQWQTEVAIRLAD